MRVLHAPANVGNNPYCLAEGERARGLDSTCLVLRPPPLGYPAHECLHLERVPRPWRDRVVDRRLARALKEVDVFHFNFGQSFYHFPYTHPRAAESGKDVPRLRDAGKRIFMTWQGCDVRQQAYVRQRFPLSACQNPRCYNGMCNPQLDAARARSAAFWTTHADRQYCISPDLVRHVPGSEFVPNCVLAAEPRREPRRPGPIRIVHAPTQREAKGTAYVIRGVEALRAHADVELILVEGKPHQEALRLYMEADLVIDQVLIGWYGGFASEVMARGIPVAAYLRLEELRYVPRAFAEALPVINVTPDRLAGVLAEVLSRPGLLQELGERARAFAQRWHAAKAVAERMAAVYADPSRSLYTEEEGLPAAAPATPDADRLAPMPALDLPWWVRGCA